MNGKLLMPNFSVNITKKNYLETILLLSSLGYTTEEHSFEYCPKEDKDILNIKGGIMYTLEVKYKLHFKSYVGVVKQLCMLAAKAKIDLEAKSDRYEEYHPYSEDLKVLDLSYNNEFDNKLIELDLYR